MAYKMVYLAILLLSRKLVLPANGDSKMANLKAITSTCKISLATRSLLGKFLVPVAVASIKNIVAMIRIHFRVLPKVFGPF